MFNPNASGVGALSLHVTDQRGLHHQDARHYLPRLCRSANTWALTPLAWRLKGLVGVADRSAIQPCEGRDTRPVLGRLVFFDWVVIHVGNRVVDRLLAVQIDLPVFSSPRLRCSAVLSVCCQRMQRLTIQFLRRFALKKVRHGLTRFSRPSQHQMNMFRQNRAGPDREPILRDGCVESPTHSGGLSSRQLDRRIL